MLPNTPLWNYFQQLTTIPRSSKKEDAVRRWLLDFAQKNNLTSTVDSAGNILMRKPAQHSYSQRSVLLQSHIDMVTVKEDASAHNFETDALQLQVQKDWLRATGTTLGADNGIGVCQIMSILGSQDIAHPPLEALFTVDEEAGMGGALGLQPGQLHSQVLLNLDSEMENEVFISSAGGRGIGISLQLLKNRVEGIVIHVSLTGGVGGHSGVDIHQGRINAVQQLCLTLQSLSCPWRLIRIHGGQASNAIPCDGYAQIVVPIAEYEKFCDQWRKVSTQMLSVMQQIEPTLQYKHVRTDQTSQQAFLEADSQRIAALISLLPQGVLGMSSLVPFLTQTSHNVGTVTTTENQVTIQTTGRSSHRPDLEILTHKIVALVNAIMNCHLTHHPDVSDSWSEVSQDKSVQIDVENEFFGWSESADSQTLATFQAAHLAVTGKPAQVKAVHAGLECGIIKQAMPKNAEAISFGPTILDAHTPQERVSISSVQKCDTLLIEVLRRLA